MRTDVSIRTCICGLVYTYVGLHSYVCVYVGDNSNSADWDFSVPVGSVEKPVALEESPKEEGLS